MGTGDVSVEICRKNEDQKISHIMIVVQLLLYGIIFVAGSFCLRPSIKKIVRDRGAGHDGL